MQDYFGSRSPLGQHIRLGRPGAQTPPIGIVGVADDVVYTWVDQVPKPAVYLSLNQFPLDAGIYMVHTAGDPASLAASSSQVISHLDNAVPLDSIESYRQYLHESLIGLWYVAYQLAVDAGIALFLCVLGIFSVMANLVTERTHEIGIRFALGTDRWSITRLMLVRGLLVTLLGLAVGTVLAFEANRLLGSILQGVRGFELPVLLAAVAAVTLISLVAGFLPARRAASVDPSLALHAS